jgi:hypothetical protein
MDWLPIDENMPVYPQDTEDYPPILICTDKAKVFLVTPEQDPKVGVCYTIYYSEIWLEVASEGTPIGWMHAPRPLTFSSSRAS